MRIGIEIWVLIASILIFIPKTIWMSALLTVRLMSGAILSHLTIIGIEHNNDSGHLFTSPIIIFFYRINYFIF